MNDEHLASLSLMDESQDQRGIPGPPSKEQLGQQEADRQTAEQGETVDLSVAKRKIKERALSHLLGMRSLSAGRLDCNCTAMGLECALSTILLER